MGQVRTWQHSDESAWASVTWALLEAGFPDLVQGPVPPGGSGVEIAWEGRSPWTTLHRLRADAGYSSALAHLEDLAQGLRVRTPCR